MPKVSSRSLRHRKLSSYKYHSPSISYPDYKLLRDSYRDTPELRKPVPIDNLRKFARTPIGMRVVSKIINTILSRPWDIYPPHEDRHSQVAADHADKLKRALQYPNCEDTDFYELLIGATLNDLLVVGEAAIERAPGHANTQPFWLWEVDAAGVIRSANWTKESAKTWPRYYFASPYQPWQIVEMLDCEMFVIRHAANSYSSKPESPFRVAYDLIRSWLELVNYQDSVVGQATKNVVISLIDTTDDELDLFRSFWAHQVEGAGRIAVVNKSVSVSRLGALTDDELFLKYEEMLLRLIALSFNLTQQDFGIESSSDIQAEEEATKGRTVALDRTFQEAIRPYIRTLNRAITRNVIDYYAPGFRFEIQERQPQTQQEIEVEAKTLFLGGVIMRSRARQMMGLRVGPGDDVYADGSRS